MPKEGFSVAKSVLTKGVQCTLPLCFKFGIVLSRNMSKWIGGLGAWPPKLWALENNPG